MAKTYWSVFLIQVEDPAKAEQDHNEHLTRLKQGGAKVIDAELRPCFALHEGTGAKSSVERLFEIQEDRPELAAAANYQIEPLEEDEGL